jgi:tRNA A-37 threonylcarbamoyl transferase component Bud32
VPEQVRCLCGALPEPLFRAVNESVISNSSANAAKDSSAFVVGKYEGVIINAFRCEELSQALAQLSDLLQAPDAELIAGGRNQNVRLTLPFQDGRIAVLVKSFGKQKRWKDYVDIHYRKTKAQRSFEAAQHLKIHNIGTPAPVAFLERRRGNLLEESYFISLFEEQVTSFHDQIINTLNRKPSCRELAPMLAQVAELCRGMHDAGYIHHDLGNQNILLPQGQGSDLNSAQIIDLNRGRIFPGLSMRQRGQDLSRLNLPSELMQMFLDIYWGKPAPKALRTWHRRYVGLFSIRANTRRLRHPFREARLAREQKLHPEARAFPAPRDIWIWDDRSDQAFSALERKERVRLYPRGRSWRMLKSTVAAVWSLRKHYRSSKARAFSAPVKLKDRLGIALDPDGKSRGIELQLLNKLGAVPILLRFCHHEGQSRWHEQADLVKKLSATGHEVKIALVQDRRALQEPDAWCQFVLEVLELTHEHIAAVEFGHAINRVKWGIWDFEELKSMYAPLVELGKRYPAVNITGPATIDFEYPFMLAAMQQWPQQVPVAAISHHLYVDRRGAPENPQSGFNAIDKFALASAIASYLKVPDSKVIVSEVNWPISGTSIYSPVTSPFEYRLAKPGEVSDNGVDESSYSDYMLRYIVLALCSGLVDRVFWWRLVARGYGLVDKNDDGEFRERPAFIALQHFLFTLGDSTFVQARLPQQREQRHGLYEFEFERPDGEHLLLCWAHGAAVATPVLGAAKVEDALGNSLEAIPKKLTGSPLYFRDITGLG